MMAGIASFLWAAWGMLVTVMLFWKTRLANWLTYRKPTDVWYEILNNAKTYEEWEEAAFQLDVLLGNDLWRQNPTSKHYDYRLINTRLQSIILAREEHDILTLVNLLRSGLVRNLGNISTPRLFNHAFAGTKLLIEDYITQVALAISYVANLPTSPGPDGNASVPGFGIQAKLDLLHDTRQAFGRSTLVLQGGAIFGLCHLGVLKALYLRGLLPRIITGTATGALIAALVGIHTEDELLEFLNGDGIDLTAFAGKVGDEVKDGGWWATLRRRVQRFMREGYFLDVKVLEECVRANVGDLTFEEAYNRTKRVLNITVVTTERGGVPNLLNYITSPHVLIWSAALASNCSTTTLYGPPLTLLTKNPLTGAIEPWIKTSTSALSPTSNSTSLTSTPTFTPYHLATYTPRTSPLARIAELFNVNHFIISQTRPYLIPFLQPSIQLSPSRSRTLISRLSSTVLSLAHAELRHRLSQLDSLSLLPRNVRRFLIDDFESVPASSITIVPDLRLRDFAHILEAPRRANVKGWIARGERAVWPAVGALKVRCAVESELDRGYQVVRRRKGRWGRGRHDSNVISGRMRRESDGGGMRGAGVGAGIFVGDAANANANADSRLRRGSRGVSVSMVDPAGAGARDRVGDVRNANVKGNESLSTQRDRANNASTSNFAAARTKWVNEVK